MIGTISARRRRTNRLVIGLTIVAVALALIPLGWILLDVAKIGVGAIHGSSFFTQGPPGDPSSPGGGIYNGIIGTLIMMGLAAALAVPMGVLGAVFLVEFARPGSRMASAVRFFADVMSGIPSIVFGIFVYALLVKATNHFSAWAGSVAIALIVWPVILRATEEVLRLVPQDLRQAAYALGAPKWRTILQVVLPAAGSGIMTGSMLGLARGAGETAPLLFTALGNQFVSHEIGAPMSALPLEIFRGATSAYEAQRERAWAAALTLILMVLVLSVGGRWLLARRNRALT
jgi:phosphate transport system permease protein